MTPWRMHHLTKAHRFDEIWPRAAPCRRCSHTWTTWPLRCLPMCVYKSMKSQFLAWHVMLITLPKTNMDPKHDGLEEKFPFNYGDFWGESMLACGSVVAIGHDNDLRISDHIVTAIGRDLCPKCTKLMRWTNIRIYPHLQNLHITVDIVCPQLRKLNYNIPVWYWLINGWVWLSCNLLLSTSTVYSHDLSTFNTWSQAPGRLILPRDTWPAAEFMTRMSWSSLMELNKCEETAQNQTKTKTLGILFAFICYYLLLLQDGC